MKQQLTIQDFLRSVEGWSSTKPSGYESYDKEGTDDYGFSGLPTGRFSVYSNGTGGYMSEIGGCADITTSSATSSIEFGVEYLFNYSDEFGYREDLKHNGRMVRCLKDF